MEKIRYSEIFKSVQGEGRFVGVPSVFFRTFGCNFHCHGFGQPRDKSKWLKPEWMPYNTMNLSGIKNVKDLHSRVDVVFKVLEELNNNTNKITEIVIEDIITKFGSQDWIFFEICIGFYEEIAPQSKNA